MSWCDKLASTPTAGFKLDWHIASPSSIVQALSPILDHLVKDRKPQFSVSSNDVFSTAISVENGYTYGIDPSAVSVMFQHRMKTKQVSGGPPIMEMLSHPLPFTELLSNVIDLLVEATLLIPGPKDRTVTYAGIVAHTAVSREELPPGISRFIKYMGRPWSGLTEHYHFQVSSNLKSNDDWKDNCLHVISKPEGSDELITLQFDWHRIFSKGRPLNEKSLIEIMKRAKESALEYFESLAEGSQFDEDVIDR